MNLLFRICQWLLISWSFCHAAPIGICLHAYSPEAPADKIDCFEFERAEKTTGGTRFFLPNGQTAVVTDYRNRGVIYYPSSQAKDLESQLRSIEEVATKTPKARAFLNPWIKRLRAQKAAIEEHAQKVSQLPTIDLPDGTQLNGCRATKIEGDIVTIHHTDGIKRIKVEDIPEPTRNALRLTSLIEENFPATANTPPLAETDKRVAGTSTKSPQANPPIESQPDQEDAKPDVGGVFRGGLALSGGRTANPAPTDPPTSSKPDDAFSQTSNSESEIPSAKTVDSPPHTAPDDPPSTTLSTRGNATEDPTPHEPAPQTTDSPSISVPKNSDSTTETSTTSTFIIASAAVVLIVVFILLIALSRKKEKSSRVAVPRMKTSPRSEKPVRTEAATGDEKIPQQQPERLTKAEEVFVPSLGQQALYIVVLATIGFGLVKGCPPQDKSDHTARQDPSELGGQIGIRIGRAYAVSIESRTSRVFDSAPEVWEVDFLADEFFTRWRNNEQNLEFMLKLDVAKRDRFKADWISGFKEGYIEEIKAMVREYQYKHRPAF